MKDSIELFAGAGGLALGLEMAGFNNVLLNDNNAYCCDTLKNNRPLWNIAHRGIETISDVQLNCFEDIALVSGGFPCQSFSYAGNREGFEDIRGTLFYEFARVVAAVQPKIFLAENVKGLVTHDEGRTLSTIKDVLRKTGYLLVEPKVLNSNHYWVPQKRERLFIFGIREDLAYNEYPNFAWPSEYSKSLTLRDALQPGRLYNSEVPASSGYGYSERKTEILSMVPEGGCWVDLPLVIQREYLGDSFYSSGGKRGMARRLSLDRPSPTITCSPSQKQTEMCHPSQTRPLTVRECARIQTFPDDWSFHGSVYSQYKQIGNAVPVNMAYVIGKQLMKLLNEIGE